MKPSGSRSLGERLATVLTKPVSVVCPSLFSVDIFLFASIYRDWTCAFYCVSTFSLSAPTGILLCGIMFLQRGSRMLRRQLQTSRAAAGKMVGKRGAMADTTVPRWFSESRRVYAVKPVLLADIGEGRLYIVLVPQPPAQQSHRPSLAGGGAISKRAIP